jgi:hypothetical protein
MSDELTPAQRKVRDRLHAHVGPADGCRWGEVFMYTQDEGGTTRMLVGRDGTLLDSTAWSRPLARRPGSTSVA